MNSQEFKDKATALIDDLKAVCASYGLGNDGNEFKIITQAFLYKFLNDKFAYEVKRIDPSLSKSESWESALRKMPKDKYEILLMQLGASTARLKPDHFLSSLWGKQNDENFSALLDATLLDIAKLNKEIFSVKTNDGQMIILFDPVTQFVASKRDEFARAIINKLIPFSFEHIFAEKFDFYATLFEYLIKDYNKDGGGKYAEYYTPHAVAKIMAACLVPAPVKDVTCYDPAAGSGTLLMNLAHAIGEDSCTLYTQDVSQKSSSLLRLNLILNNLVHSIPHVVQGNTILEPYHKEGSGLRRFDYIVSNPPFKLDFSDFDDPMRIVNVQIREQAEASIKDIVATLSIEDRTERARYVDHFMSRDTLSGGCGHLSMPSLLARHFTPDGHWKEPGGYHNFPVSSLLQASLTMERNGHDVFRRYPALFQASHAMLKYSFPDLRAPSIGDTGPTSQSPECLEIGLLFAKRYDTAVYGQLATSLRVLMDKNGYDRSKSGFLGLLCFLPDVSTNAPRPYEWPRSGTLDFAKCYLQRNGTERMHGLMYAVQGASYNHNHANGMAVELYGMGRVMAPDPGKGITYEAPMHVDYYAQWAAHNTVVAGSRSTSVPPVKGGGGTKRIGEIALAAMEPMPEKPAVSEWVSFTDTRYTDISTKARQQRTLAIVRTTDTTGYYVDIYRSDHPASNEYVYHNVGEGSELRKMDGSAMSSISSSIRLHADPYDPPGLRMIDTVRKADAASGIVVFRAGEGRMRALYAPEKGRTLFSGMAPPTKTASAEYRERRTPVLVWRQEGEAWSRPFVAVYEPHGAASGHSVDSIRLVSPSSSAHRFSAVEVLGNARSGHARQMVLQSTDADSSYAADDWSFRGHFGLIGWRADTLHYLYLGQGWEIGWGPYRLTVPVGVGNASMEVVGGGLRITCPQETVLSVTGFQGGSLRAEGAAVALKVSVDGDGAHITLPAVRGLVLYIGG